MFYTQFGGAQKEPMFYAGVERTLKKADVDYDAAFKVNTVLPVKDVYLCLVWIKEHCGTTGWCSTAETNLNKDASIILSTFAPSVIDHAINQWQSLHDDYSENTKIFCSFAFMDKQHALMFKMKFC